MTNTTICRAEQTALIFALDKIQEHQPQRAVIFTDSLSSLSLLQHSPYHKDNLTLEILIKNMHLKMNNINVTFCWVPSHCDIIGNERADFLAKEALNKKDIDISIENNKEEYVNLRLQYHIAMWQKSWDTTTHGRFLHNTHPKVNIKPIPNALNLPRKMQVAYNRLLLGRAWLNDTLFGLKLINSDKCTTCNKQESVTHFIFECTRYNQQRTQLITATQPDDFTPKTVFSQKNVQHLLNYIKNTKKYNF